MELIADVAEKDGVDLFDVRRLGENAVSSAITAMRIVSVREVRKFEVDLRVRRLVGMLDCVEISLPIRNERVEQCPQMPLGRRRSGVRLP